MTISMTYPQFLRLIKVRNSGCPIAWLQQEIPAGTYNFPHGVVSWAPNNRQDIINIIIKLSHSKPNFNVVRPKDAQVIVISNNSVEIEYQGGINRAAKLYVEEDMVLMGDFPVMLAEPVRYRELEEERGEKRRRESLDIWTTRDPFSDEKQQYKKSRN